MVFIESTDVEIDKRVMRVCAPLFATEQFLRSGHDESATNATVTFVRFESRVYAVTCHHVIAAFLAEVRQTDRRIVPSIHSGKAIFHFGSYNNSGHYVWSFVSCREFLSPSDVGNKQAMDSLERRNANFADIAIAEITSVWPTLSSLRDADAIDLDAWAEPDWSHSQPLWLAYGFPDAHKSRRDDKVEAPMPRVTISLESVEPTPERPTYMLCSSLEEDHGWGFSGLSGGPVLIAHVSEGRYAFVGITFEGTPSAKDLEEDPDAIFGKRDIVLRGYHLTPEVFGKWLTDRKYTVALA